MFEWLINWFKPKPIVKEYPKSEIIDVNDPDDAKMAILERCFNSGKSYTGTVEWDEKTGKGKLKIKEVEP